VATTLFFDVVSGGPAAGKLLSVTRGIGATSQGATTSAGGDHKLYDFSGAKTDWWYQVNAVTISGTVSFNVWGSEDAMATNCTAACRVARCDSAGTEISDVVANANAGHLDNVEYGTVTALQTWTATPTSTSFNDGDWIKVIPHADAFGVMAVGSATLRFGGTTGGADGDSFVTFTETITAYTPAADMPYRSPLPPLLAQ